MSVLHYHLCHPSCQYVHFCVQSYLPSIMWKACHDWLIAPQWPWSDRTLLPQLWAALKSKPAEFAFVFFRRGSWTTPLHYSHPLNLVLVASHHRQLELLWNSHIYVQLFSFLNSEWSKGSWTPLRQKLMALFLSLLRILRMLHLLIENLSLFEIEAWRILI